MKIEANLNFKEEDLGADTTVGKLYTKLYQGFESAGSMTAPDFNDPPVLETGEIDADNIQKEIDKYSVVLRKNSAFLLSSSIAAAISDEIDTLKDELSQGGDSGGTGGESGGTGGGGGGSVVGDFLPLVGGTMIGELKANYGFQAGLNNQKFFDITAGEDKALVGNMTGSLIVSNDLAVGGQLSLSDDGLYFGSVHALYFNSPNLCIENDNISMVGAVTVSTSLSLGDLKLTPDGIYFKDIEFYHSGNCNKEDVDWTMFNGYVYGDLEVHKSATVMGMLKSQGGFLFSMHDQNLLYTGDSESIGEDGVSIVHNPYVILAKDLEIVGNHGIKVDGSYVVKVRSGVQNVVSFAAPGKVMNLGDSDGTLSTVHIALQSDIFDHNGSYRMISKYGDGNFPNSFSAGCSNSSSSVIYTFLEKESRGIVLPEELRFGTAQGPALYSADNTLRGILTYEHVINELPLKDILEFSIMLGETTSAFRDISKDWSATLNFDTDAEFFAFSKPVEADSFSIKGEKYKTRLSGNTLFFNDGKFIEGVTGGIRYSGNSFFDHNLSSRSFASGFAGYGWAIKEDELAGGIAATFDVLTVRKKARFYELEIQKLSVTNGSLWVSDSCSGDEVRVL